jgi:hypothetical protein
MRPRFIDDFEKREWLGREALKEVKEMYPQYFKYELQFTTDKYDDYDAYYFVIDKDTFSITKRVIIEIKIRDTSFDEYILEEKKYKALLKKRESMGFSKDEMSILYINFTPDNTIVWDLDKIDFNKEKLVANKATSDSRSNKINKSITYLNPSMGKVIKYSLNEGLLLKKWDANYLLPLIEKKVKTIKGLEDILFQE